MHIYICIYVYILLLHKLYFFNQCMQKILCENVSDSSCLWCWKGEGVGECACGCSNGYSKPCFIECFPQISHKLWRMQHAVTAVESLKYSCHFVSSTSATQLSNVQKHFLQQYVLMIIDGYISFEYLDVLTHMKIISLSTHSMGRLNSSISLPLTL